MEPVQWNPHSIRGDAIHVLSDSSEGLNLSLLNCEAFRSIVAPGTIFGVLQCGHRMLLQTTPAPPATFDSVISEFTTGIISTVPKMLAGLLFLTLAYLTIKLVLTVSRVLLDRIYPPTQDLIVDLIVAVVGLFLWFGAALALLKIVGLGDIAASLGTAAGFIGLGIAFALKEMIADTVAGVYLLQDPDFNQGDLVDTASVTGTISDIGLRKTRLQADDGDLIVLANRDVEKKWTKEVQPQGTGYNESGSQEQ